MRRKMKHGTCIVVQLGTLPFPPVSDGANVPFAGRADEADRTEDVFAAEDRVEASEAPVETKGRVFWVARKRVHGVRPSHIELARLRGPD